MAPVSAFFFSGRESRSVRTSPSRRASTCSVTSEPSTRQRQGSAVDEAGAGHDRLLQASRRGEQVLSEEAAERDAGRVSRIGLAGLHRRGGGERAFRERRASAGEREQAQV